MNRRIQASALLTIIALALAGCPTAPVIPEPAPTPPKPPVVAAPPVVTPAPKPPPPPEPVAPKPAVTAKPAPPPEAFPPMRPGESAQQILIDGQRRVYNVFVPAGYTGKEPLPLVVVLHMRGSSAQSARLLGFNQKAQSARFIVAYPEAMGQPRVWNAGHDSGMFRGSDVAYIAELVATLRRMINVDARRIYIAGHSSGGMMAYRAAAELSPVFAAVGVIGASVGSRGADGVVQRVPEPAQPVSVLHIHGRQDRTVPLAGGRSATLAGADYLSVRDSIAFWTQANKCPDPKPRASQSGNVLRETYAACANGTTVELITLTTGGHEWPRAIMLEPRKPQNAADVIWDFFRSQSKR